MMQLFELGDVVALEVKDGQVIKKAEVEQIVYFIVRDIELLEVEKGLDALHFFELAPGEMKDPNEAKRGA